MVKNDAGERLHFTVTDGQVTECAGHEEGFGPMLLEPHLTRGFMHQGEFKRTHRYSMCFAPYELYSTQSADQLRESRQRKKAEREAQLFTTWAEQISQDDKGPEAGR